MSKIEIANTLSATASNTLKKIIPVCYYVNFVGFYFWEITKPLKLCMKHLHGF